MPWIGWPVTLVAVLGCRGPAAPPAGLRLTATMVGPETRLTLHAEPHLKISARLVPVLELADGSLLRFSAAGRTADSAYFAEPPSTVVAGHPDPVHGTLRASVCRDDERVCRSVRIEL
jgi:hypothetical protein